MKSLPILYQIHDVILVQTLHFSSAPLSLSGVDIVLGIEDCDTKSLKNLWEGSKLVCWSCMYMCICINDSMFRDTRFG